jgi:hypothetical protein
MIHDGTEHAHIDKALHKKHAQITANQAPYAYAGFMLWLYLNSWMVKSSSNDSDHFEKIVLRRLCPAIGCPKI